MMVVAVCSQSEGLHHFTAASFRTLDLREGSEHPKPLEPPNLGRPQILVKGEWLPSLSCEVIKTGHHFPVMKATIVICYPGP